MKKLIVIADWASDLLTCQEFRTTVEGFSHDSDHAKISFVSSTPSTIHTSFLISQIVQTEERYGTPLKTIIFQNTDPRLQSKVGVEKAQGAKFIIIKLKSGIYLCGPNAGNDFSMIKEKIDEVFCYPNLDKGSQFRSRDLFSRVCAHLMDGMEKQLELEEIHSNEIPEIRDFFVTHIDNYGNIKTSIKLEDLKGKYQFGQKIKICINKTIKLVTFTHNLFGSTPGNLVIYPGSSGNSKNPYLEISAWSYFTENTPKTGLFYFKEAKPGVKIDLKF